MLEERISELIAALNANTAALAAVALSAAEVAPATEPEVVVENGAPVQPKPATLAEVREALLAHKNRHDRAVTLDLLKQFVPEGAQLIVGNVPTERYGDLISAAEAA